MRHGNSAVCHHDHQIPQAQFEARVPAHAQNDDLSVEVPSFEQIFDRDEPLHLFISARHSSQKNEKNEKNDVPLDTGHNL